ncbi:hypothetical protein KY289_037098 [Solanum tuberosum]|nr:hypothetical protein KY289_037098 [Solanum tuberosum]
MKATPPSVNQAYALIVQDENQKSSSVGHFSSGEGMDPTTLFTARGAPTRNFGDLYCDYCHMQGHTREQCFKLKFCDHCKSRGHLRETCYQLIRYPADFKGKKKANLVTRNGHSGEPPQSQLSSGHGKQSEQSQLIQGNVIYNGQDNYTWIIDTGATNHMVGNDKMLLNGAQDLLTENVRVIGKEDDGLYILQGTKGQHDTIPRKSLAVQGSVDAMTWHRRLGHVPMRVLMRFTCFKNNLTFHLDTCDVCPLARQTRMPFPDKLSARSIRSVFLGYSSHQKGYKLLDLITHKIFVSRDVMFNEHIFLFRLLNIPQDLQPHCFTPMDQYADVDVSMNQDTSISQTTVIVAEPSTTHDQSEDVDVSSNSDATGLIPSQTRKSGRSVRPPIWFKDYAPTIGGKAHHCQYHISDVIAYDVLSSSYQSFISKFSLEIEPNTYDEAAADYRWVAAMKDEITALNNNHTWEIVDLPKGKIAIGC